MKIAGKPTTNLLGGGTRFDVVLSVDSTGHFGIDGDWLDIPKSCVVEVVGFGFEISKFGMGSTSAGDHWLGFSGALKLVDGMPAGASVDGLRLTLKNHKTGKPDLSTL